MAGVDSLRALRGAGFRHFSPLPEDQLLPRRGTTGLNFKKLNPDSEKVIVITQFYHISRAKLALKKVGIKNVGGASPDYFESRDFYSLFREFFGYYKYFFLY